MDGNTLEQIDTSRPLELAGCDFSKMTDPEMRALAEKLNEPNMLNVKSPSGMISIQGHDATDLIELLKRPRYPDLFEGDLQCLAETKDGEPLLTTFFSIEQLESLLRDSSGHFPGLETAAPLWRSSGLRQASLEGFAVPGYKDGGDARK